MRTAKPIIFLRIEIVIVDFNCNYKELMREIRERSFMSHVERQRRENRNRCNDITREGREKF